MIRRWLGVVILFAVFLVQPCFAADLKDGFMKYSWGDPKAKHLDLKRLHSKGEVVYYSNPNEVFTIEDIAIHDVVYGFYDHELFAAFIRIDTLEKYDAIERYLRSKYGLPATKVSSKDSLTTYKWKYQDVTLKLKTDQINGNMKLGIYYTPLVQDLRKNTLEIFEEQSFQFAPIDKNKRPEKFPFLVF